MDALIQLLDKNYELYDCRIRDSDIIMEIVSKINRFFCPYCGHPSDRVHSRYQREVQDLPIQGKRVILRVSGIFSQLISEEDGWDEEGRKQEKLKSAMRKNLICDHRNCFCRTYFSCLQKLNFPEQE
ncbi:MAG: transposase family protein [Acetatifactor sp.]|nr:transposase family protein [Acetatifactor sp.]